MTEWWQWVQSVRGNDSNYRSAQKTGLSSGNFSQWAKGGRAGIEAIIAFSDGYGVSAIDGLVAAGYVTRDQVAAWLKQSIASASVADASDEELLHEIGRRLKAPDHTTTLTPVAELPTPDDEARPTTWDGLAAMTDDDD